jgi:REP element-mobilizing transposase RayT
MAPMNDALGFEHCNLRKGRVSLPGQVYIVTTTTIGRTPIFADFEVALAASRAIGERRAGLTVLCWVLMPDHLHALVELNEGTLSQAVGNLKARAAACANRARGMRAPVWARAFHDRALRREDDMLDIARYIISNPLRAGLVRSVRAYPFWDAVWVGGSPQGEKIAAIAAPTNAKSLS